MAKPRTEKHARRRQGGRTGLLLGLLLGCVTFLAFARTLGHPFVNYDDQVYVFENPYLQGGLSAQSLTWALTTQHGGNWHPLTWISLLLDYQIYGLKPLGYHLTNLLLHLASVLLLFYLLTRMTGSLGKSAFVAGLFALHPQRVESVAWVAERKDVLSTLLWMLTVWGYLRYVGRPGIRPYLLVLLLFSLGLMAKPMLVSLPLVLLLLDYWPLRRLSSVAAKRLRTGSPGALSLPATSAKQLALEKVPLLLLALGSSLLTLSAQKHGEAVASIQILSLGARLANAVVAYAMYVGKLLWPVHLAVFYPHPGTALPAWQIVFSLCFLALVSALIWRRRDRAYLVTGWLWFGITLIPVIGIIQVGTAAMADRYTYIPHIGLYLIIAWGAPDLLASRAGFFKARGMPVDRALSTGAVLLLLALSVGTWAQAGVWRDSVTLWTHAVGVTRFNYRAHCNLAKVFYDQGQLAKSEREYLEALRIKPDEPGIRNNLGIVLAKEGRLEEAMSCYSEALQIEPETAEVYGNRALLFVRMGKLEAAVADYRKALALQPEYIEGHFNLGLALTSQGKLDEAAAEFRRVLGLRPDFVRAREMLNKLSQAERGRASGPGPK